MARSLSRLSPLDNRLDNLLVLAVLGGSATVTGAAALLTWAAPGPVAAVKFLLLALGTWLLVGLVLWQERAGAAAERATTTAAPATLGLATQLTLLRGLLVSLVAGFAFVEPIGFVRWVPGALYTLAALTDRCDGMVARRLGQVSELGARLDVAMDALGLVVAPLVAVRWGRLPPWYLLLGAAYYLFHAGVALRRRLGLPVFPERLRPNRYARFFGGVQMALVASALFPVLSPRVTTIAATVLMLPTLYLFAREWLRVVSQPPADRGAPAR
jgi:CDP-diacylglycerol--glycerol-3-phosphate 3-phosphatidyltransferase